MTNEDDQNEALEQLAYLLMPDTNQQSDASVFFNTEGRKILTASLISFYHKGLDFIDICEKIVGSSWQDLFTEIDSTANNAAIRYINSFSGASTQNTSGCKQAADAAIKLFATNTAVKKSIRRPHSDQALSFSPGILETTSVFISIEDSKLKLYSQLLHIITAQSLEYFSDRSNDSDTTILFCLDEFASLGKMDIVDGLRKLRKKHIRIMMLTQGLTDLDLVYGRDERIAMMNNFSYICVLNATDPTSQEYFAQLVGHKSKKKLSLTLTEKKNQITEWNIEPEDFRKLGDKLILLYPEGYMKLYKNFYYK